MHAIRRTVTVPATRELHIKLPDEAAAHEVAEVIILFKSVSPGEDGRLAAMREAMGDDLYIADLVEAMEDFRRADHAEKIAGAPRRD